ncbi:MAG: NrtA/SsuA/CpmA family ABC transporter substrate-binding protein [Thermodesulfobacteriota bacterium]
MSKDKRPLGIICHLLFLYIVAIFSIQGCVPGEEEKNKPAAKQGLLKHPIYSKYEFSDEDSVINIGVQPLFIPTGHIVETIKRDGVFREALSELGMVIKYYSFLKGSDVNYFLKRSDLDIGIGGDMPTLTAASSIDIVIPSLFQLGFTSIMANRHMLLTELRGRRIGYALGSNAHYGLLNALAQEGISENDVRLVSMDVNKMPERLRNGSISAFSAWEPTPTISLKINKDSVIIHQSQSSGYIYFSREFAEKYPEPVKHVIAAEIRAIRWIQKSRQNLLSASKWALLEAEILSGNKPSLSIKEYMELAKKDILGMDSDPVIPEIFFSGSGTLRREFELLKSIGKIPANFHWKRVRDSFDLDVINEVIGNSLKYKLNEFEYDND